MQNAGFRHSFTDCYIPISPPITTARTVSNPAGSIIYLEIRSPVSLGLQNTIMNAEHFAVIPLTSRNCAHFWNCAHFGRVFLLNARDIPLRLYAQYQSCHFPLSAGDFRLNKQNVSGFRNYVCLFEVPGFYKYFLLVFSRFQRFSQRAPHHFNDEHPI